LQLADSFLYGRTSPTQFQQFSSSDDP
jgi:hypothetical protein